MSLSRRHFVALAAILHQHNASPSLVDAIADFCATEARTFDRARFLTAARPT